MDYIVLDIEFNGRKFASPLPMEVIEIGAVRFDASLRPIDEFSAFIKPVYFSKLNSFIKKKTGIPQESIDQADGFRKVSTEFVAWLKQSESGFLLFTWGGEDLKRIIFDTRMHKMDDSFWMALRSFDLLKGFLRHKNLTNDVSVTAALTELGIADSGSAHRALDDARMTSEVLRAVFDHLDLSRADTFKDVYSNAKERRIVKNAIRAMQAQKTAPTWELIADHYFKDKEKGTLEDPRKVAELRQYFDAEMAKPVKSPVKPAARPDSSV